MNKIIFSFFLSISLNILYSQGLTFESSQLFTHQDSLRGSDNPERNNWDVQYYALSIKPDFETKYIKGTNTISFICVNTSKSIQIDLQEPMQIDAITSNEIQDAITFSREGNAYHVFFTNELQKGKSYNITINFSGFPKIAKNAPWDGGWIFTRDEYGNPWMSVACQGLGASVWYPNKDFLADEPDKGMSCTINTKEGLLAVSNGKQDESTDKYATTWRVTNPINNYNIIPYIGNYTHFNDDFQGERGHLPLNYWVLKQHEKVAKKQFEQVQPMLEAFEYWLGPYPFYEDGYKIVESPYPGMEHQSAIAYGNKYSNGYLGNDLSGTGIGLSFDFIIIHETAHEWFGNNITIKDIADMWVHEAFTTYAETLYIEYTQNKKNAEAYIIGQRKNILNDLPIIGPYGVNKEGSSDMYFKGANMLHTLRYWVNDDKKYKETLRKMNKTFWHQTVTSQQIENFLAKEFKLPLTGFFDQYLRTTQVPVLEYTLKNNQLTYRWNCKITNFNLPIKTADNILLHPTNKWKTIPFKNSKLTINPNYYIQTTKIN